MTSEPPKTTDQKVREAQAWKDIEAFQAGQRNLSTLKQGNFRPDVENFPHREQGKTRDAIASRVGLGSGRTYSKAAKVIAMIDELELDEIEEEMLDNIQRRDWFTATQNLYNTVLYCTMGCLLPASFKGVGTQLVHRR